MGCLPGSLEPFHSVQKLQKRCNKVVIGYKELLAACAGTLAGVFRELSNLSPSGESFCAENGQTKGPQLICQSSAEWDTAGVNPPPPNLFSLLGEDFCLWLWC